MYAQKDTGKFQLCEHPWLALFVITVTIVLSSILTGIVVYVLIGLPYKSTTGQFITLASYHILTVFLFTPLILRLPTLVFAALQKSYPAPIFRLVQSDP